MADDKNLDASVEEKEKENASLEEGNDRAPENDNQVPEAEYKKHKFSLFDSAAEILLVIFIVAFAGYRVIDFFFMYPDGTDLETIFTYIFNLVIDVLPGICLIGILELHEKVNLMAHNLELTSKYMAMYQGDLLDRFDDLEDMIEGEAQENIVKE